MQYQRICSRQTLKAKQPNCLHLTNGTKLAVKVWKSIACIPAYD